MFEHSQSVHTRCLISRIPCYICMHVSSHWRRCPTMVWNLDDVVQSYRPRHSYYDSLSSVSGVMNAAVILAVHCAFASGTYYAVGRCQSQIFFWQSRGQIQIPGESSDPLVVPDSVEDFYFLFFQAPSLHTRAVAPSVLNLLSNVYYDPPPRNRCSRRVHVNGCRSTD